MCSFHSSHDGARERSLVSLNFYWELKISKAFYWTSATSAGHAQKLSFNFHDVILTLVRVRNWPKIQSSLSLVKIIKKIALQWFLNNNGKIRTGFRSLINHKLVYCSPLIVKNNANDYFQSNFPGRLIFAFSSQHIQQLNNYHGNKHEIYCSTHKIYLNSLKIHLKGHFWSFFVRIIVWEH